MDDTLLEIYKKANSQNNVYSKALANFLFREVIEDIHTKYTRCYVMSAVYGFEGYIFKKETDSAEIGAYFTIVQPNGKVLESNHYFSSEMEIRQWVLEQIS